MDLAVEMRTRHAVCAVRAVAAGGLLIIYNSWPGAWAAMPPKISGCAGLFGRICADGGTQASASDAAADAAGAWGARDQDTPPSGSLCE